MHCDDETLAAYALGDIEEVSDRDVQHVRDCASCRQALDELENTANFLRQAQSPVTVEQPSPQVWSRILTEVSAEAPAEVSAEAPAEVSAEAPAEVSAEEPAVLSGSSGRRIRWRTAIGIAAAASIGIGIGLGVGVGLDEAGSPSTDPEPPVAATADLRPVGGGSLLGEAKLLQTGDVTELQVDTPAQQVDTGYLEVWLLNEDGTRMISIGVLESDQSHRFPVPASAVDNGYVIVDVSHEQFDDDATHSGDSTMRGRLQL